MNNIILKDITEGWVYVASCSSAHHYMFFSLVEYLSGLMANVFSEISPRFISVFHSVFWFRVPEFNKNTLQNNVSFILPSIYWYVNTVWGGKNLIQLIEWHHTRGILNVLVFPILVFVLYTSPKGKSCVIILFLKIPHDLKEHIN